MIKKLLLPFFSLYAVFFTAQSFSAKYNFASVSGSCVSNCSVDPTALPLITGLSLGSFSATGTDAAPNASGRFSFQGWPTGSTNGVDTYTAFTGSLSPTSYYEVTLAPQAGYTLSVSGISFSMRRSGTGVRNYAVRSSLDGYAGNLPGGTGGNPDLSVLNGNIFFWNFDAASTSADQVGSAIYPDSTFSALTDTVGFRFYAWNAEGSLGTFSIDSVVFSGLAYNAPPVATGLNQVTETGSDIRLFPDPSPDGKVKIESEAALSGIELFNCLGQPAFLQPDPPSGTSVQLDLSFLPAGTYLVKILQREHSYYRRLVICR